MKIIAFIFVAVLVALDGQAAADSMEDMCAKPAPPRCSKFK